MRPITRTAALVTVGLVSTTLVVPTMVAGQAGAAAAPCTPATNIQAIVDDSGSMALTDDGRLRVQAMNLLIDALGNSTILGATEFGTAANPVFAPAPVGGAAAAMKASLDALVQADNGTTDYNAAFDAARTANPVANARIFLTDGGHNEGDYRNAHLNAVPPQTPTYVIGFSPGLAGPADQARLQQIASDTGGTYYALPDAQALQSVMNDIQTKLTCQSAPKVFTDTLTQGKSKGHTVKIDNKSKQVQLTLTWTSALDTFKIKNVKIVRNGDVVAGKIRHLKVKIKKGSTYMVVTVTKLVPGKLKFKVKSTKIGSGAPQVVLTTQVSQSKHKR
ncbi:MAG TPA: VWA domain-containing protein [Nocardioides sp.]|uniref:vWA domain-containing protein n=1 Tax=uncultured Nocardioides sp. TaxID=198441 RepID=UPI002618DCC5|nr:VWA domain-containing protein [uncultured Nocardioides sp.]HRD60926.1 VWA domain-containing protein [Nocardioides sp.]HRI95294.1 VWA domain-containing protein [Nocardioides sp.]HRK45776.1 VWA domain-containing protein [Nocardioides sp.]